MPATPWRTFKSSILPDASCVALLSYLPLKSYSRLLPFFFYTAQVARQLAHAPGILGYSVLTRPIQLRFWTLSAWQDDPSLQAFVQSPPHVRIMASLAPHMGETKFVRWSVNRSELPLTWKDALSRLTLI